MYTKRDAPEVHESSGSDDILANPFYKVIRLGSGSEQAGRAREEGEESSRPQNIGNLVERVVPLERVYMRLFGLYTESRDATGQ